MISSGYCIFIHLGDWLARGKPPMVGQRRLIVLMRVLLEVLRLGRILGCCLFKGMKGLSQMRLSLELVSEEEFGG